MQSAAACWVVGIVGAVCGGGGVTRLISSEQQAQVSWLCAVGGSGAAVFGSAYSASGRWLGVSHSPVAVNRTPERQSPILRRRGE